jgi:hypothetical protein
LFGESRRGHFENGTFDLDKYIAVDIKLKAS